MPQAAERVRKCRVSFNERRDATKRMQGTEKSKRGEKWPSRLTGNTIGRKQRKFGIINLMFRSGSFRTFARDKG